MGNLLDSPCKGITLGGKIRTATVFLKMNNRGLSLLVFYYGQCPLQPHAGGD